MMGASNRRVARVEGAGVAVVTGNIRVVSAAALRPVAEIQRARVPVVTVLDGPTLTLSRRKRALVRKRAKVSVALVGTE